MGEERCSYAYNRVLIDSGKVLDPQFDDAVIHVSGAQLEMLRNMTQYLARLSTYVAEYNPGYYLTPTIEDFDTILEIVADLEEVLMGNDNTIWGFYERWSDIYEHTMTESASYTLTGTVVPAGYVYVLEAAIHRNFDSAVTQLTKIVGGGIQIPIGEQELVGANSYGKELNRHHTLQAGDAVACRFYSAQDEDRLEIMVWGYKMKVPS